jgi:hypothetical protein
VSTYVNSFYEANTAHNTTLLPRFAHMNEAIGSFGRGLRGHAPYETSGPFLKKRKDKMSDGFKNYKESCGSAQGVHL